MDENQVVQACPPPPKQGVWEDLRSGGLIRSAGGVVALLAKNLDGHEAADERILGSGDFVESVLNARTTVHGSLRLRVDVILKEVSEHSGVSVEQILGQSKVCIVSKARLDFFSERKMK